MVTRERVLEAIELVGIGLLVAAAAMVAPALGLAVAGIALIVWANVR